MKKERSEVRQQERLRIRLLNRMEIEYGGQRVDDVLNKSKKARALIAFLVLRKGKTVPYEDIFSTLWSRSNSADLDNILKVLVSRTRMLLGTRDPGLRECIVTLPGGYAWNMEMTSEVDVYQVEELSQELLYISEMTDEYQRKLDILMQLYAGKLAIESYEAQWISEYARQLEAQYRNVVMHALELLSRAQAWQEMVAVCRKGLTALPFEAQWHERMLEALAMLNEKSAPSKPSAVAREMPKRQPRSAKVPMEVVQLHEELPETDAELDRTLNELRDDLYAHPEYTGAQICDYSVLKYVYEQNLRTCDRINTTRYVGMLRVTSATGEDLQPLVREAAIQQLSRVLQVSLRKCDTISRYSPSEVAVLLQGPSKGAVRSILERVRTTFHQEMPNPNLVLTYHYKEMQDREETRVMAGNRLGSP